MMTEIVEINDIQQLEEVCTVIKEAHEAVYKASGLVINTTNLTAEQLRKEILEYGGKCLAYASRGSICGTLSIFHDSKKYWFSPDNTMTIKYVAVRPEYQGRHIASDLLQYTKDNLTDVSTLMVSTDQRNVNAIKLYEKSGFRIVDVTRGKKAKSNAVRLAWWPGECPFSEKVINGKVFLGKAKCLIKAIIRF